MRSAPAALSSTPCAPDIGAQRSARRLRLAERARRRFDRLEPQPPRRVAADPGDLGGEETLDDLDRLGEQRARVARLGRAGPAEPRRRRLRLDRDGLVDLARAAGEPRDFGAAEALGGEQRGEPAQAGAREARIRVRGILGEADAFGRADLDQRALGQGEQRPREGECPERDRGRHAGEAADPRTAQQPEQHGLRLIVGVMGGDDDIGADPSRAGAEQGVARRARKLLDSALGLGPGPFEAVMGQAEAPGERGDRLRLGGGARAQPMVDRGDGDRRPAARGRPARRQDQQCGRIGSAGHREQQALRRSQRRQQRRDPRRRKRRGTALRAFAQEQWSLRFSLSTTRFSAWVALG